MRKAVLYIAMSLDGYIADRGGADIINQLSGFIDEYRITIIPTILGGGIPLFDAARHTAYLKLIKTEKYNDLIELTYQKEE